MILTSEILNELVNTNSLKLQEINQKKSGKNYYINPTLSLSINNAKISWIDSYQKNISFIFNKYENLSLLNFLKYVQQHIINLYNKHSNNPQKLSYMYYEKGDYFYIKVYLPNINKKYSIVSKFNSKEEEFKPGTVGTIYNNIIIDIRNIWEKNNLAGINLELKETSILI